MLVQALAGFISVGYELHGIDKLCLGSISFKNIKPPKTLVRLYHSRNFLFRNKISRRHAFRRTQDDGQRTCRSRVTQYFEGNADDAAP